MKKNNKLPEFENIKELQEFWDSHEFSDFQHEFSEIHSIKFDIKDHTFLPVSSNIYEKIEKIASEQKTSVNNLIKHWIQEKVEMACH